MKYDNKYFMQVSRAICDDEHKDKLSMGAKWLFVVLNELEQRFCSHNTDWFYRSDEDLAIDAGVSIGTLKKYKSELKNNANDLVKMGKMHWVNQNGKKSENHVTTYKILK